MTPPANQHFSTISDFDSVEWPILHPHSRLCGLWTLSQPSTVNFKIDVELYQRIISKFRVKWGKKFTLLIVEFINYTDVNDLSRFYIPPSSLGTIWFSTCNLIQIQFFKSQHVNICQQKMLTGWCGCSQWTRWILQSCAESTTATLEVCSHIIILSSYLTGIFQVVTIWVPHFWEPKWIIGATQAQYLNWTMSTGATRKRKTTPSRKQKKNQYDHYL